MARLPVRKLWKLAVALAGVASVVPRVEAAWLSIGRPVEVASGWTRITGRYGSESTAPVFQAIARCGGAEAAVHVLERLVHLAPADGSLWIDLPGTPERLVPDRLRCEAPALSIEMLVDATVVASAPVRSPDAAATSLPAAALAPPPAAARTARRLTLTGQKYGAPTGKRTEAGLAWALDSRVSIQLNYERTSAAPMMSYDHDDGILTRLRVGF